MSGDTSVAGGDGGPVDGSGGPCTPQTDEWVGALLTLNVTWAPVTAADGSPTTGTVPPIYLWTLAHYTINGNAITGTTRTCGTQIPALVLNATGIAAEGLSPTLTNVQVLDELPTKLVWDNDTRTATTTGTLGGWNIGSSISIDPTTSVSGLTPTSTYANTATPWPGQGMSSVIPTTDFSDDDNDGNPGITLYPVSDNSMGYYLPATELGDMPISPTPHADKLYIVSRTEVTLYGFSTSCTASSGMLTAPVYDSHVIGCHDIGTPETADCTSGEWQFIDSNATVYAGTGGKNTLITGSFSSKQVAGADGGAPSCDDVVAAFPSPMPQVALPQGDD
jgi:hypothetical protein